MTPERWQVIKGLFQECLGVEPARRGEFLASREISGEIRAEVERLLHQLEDAGESCLDPPASAVQALQPRSGVLKTGETLSGRFRIEALIGSGGMGEVYRARDPLLGRDVAIKVLKE